MHAVGFDHAREIWIGADQQQKPTCLGDALEPFGGLNTIRRAEMPIHHGAAARQARRDGARIGRTLRIGEEEQRRVRAASPLGR